MPGGHGWIKIDRDLLNWEHFQEPTMLTVWLWLLLKANVKTAKFQGYEIGVGQLATSYDSIADGAFISKSTARRCIAKLKESGEIEYKNCGRFAIITINNFKKYQSRVFTDEHIRVSTDEHLNEHLNEHQSKNNKNAKEERNKKESQPCLTQADNSGEVWS